MASLRPALPDGVTCSLNVLMDCPQSISTALATMPAAFSSRMMFELLMSRWTTRGEQAAMPSHTCFAMGRMSSSVGRAPALPDTTPEVSALSMV